MRRLAVAGCIAALAAAPHRARAEDVMANAQILFGAAYATPAAIPLAYRGASAGPGARYLPGQGLLRLSSVESPAFAGVGYVDSLRIATAGYDPLPGAYLTRPGAAPGSPAQDFDVTYVRHWPSILSVNAGQLNLDVTPHAGLGMSSSGAGQAEAGALVRLQNQVMRVMGMTDADRPAHLYLYAGATGRTIGPDPSLTQTTLASGDTFVRDAEVGLGFEHGLLSASLGYRQERVTFRTLGDSRTDSRVGLTLSLH